MDKFLTAALAPFGLFVMLLIAWPIKRLLQLHMREGRLKRLLLDRRGDAMQAWCERFDARVGAFLRRLIRWPLGR